MHVNVHKKRLWFVLNNTTKAAYLGTEAVAGAATTFELGSVFNKGGYLQAMTTWTLDGGAGPDDYAVFVSSRGQVALYQGTDPASASTWALVGVFDVAEPIGRRCFVRYGATPLLVTQQGVLKLNLSLKEDKADLQATALSGRIHNAVNEASRDYGSLFGWQAVVYPRGNRIIVNIPTAENSTAKQYVMNTLTGAWCEFDNHNANCWVVYNDKLYFADNTGAVYEADTGSTDVAATIQATGQLAYGDFNSGTVKHFKAVQPIVRSTTTAQPRIGISTDFKETSNLVTLPPINAGGAEWDAAVWDTDEWSSIDNQTNDWTSVGALGVWGSVKFTAETGGNRGSSLWGVSEWAVSEWGGAGTGNQTMQIFGIVMLYESGGYF